MENLPTEALEREFLEETKIQVSLGNLLYCSRKFHQNPDYPSEQLIHIFYQVHSPVESVSNLGNNDDVLGVHWIERQNLADLRIMPVDREFIECAAFKEIFESIRT